MRRPLIFCALIAALAMAPTASFALCFPLLSATAPSTKETLTLSGCEVTIEPNRIADGAALVLKLDERHATIWRQALAPATGFGSDLLTATATAGGAGLGNGLPRGPLVYVHSARMIPGSSWLWDDKGGRLILRTNDTARVAPPSPASAPATLPCPDPKAGAFVFWRDIVEMAPGEVFAPIVYLTQNPHSFDRIPPGCVAGWSLSPDAPAMLAASGIGVGEVNSDARERLVFTIRATVAGRAVEGRVRVVDPVKQAIVGTWHQVLEAPCGGALQKPVDIIHELVFDGAQHFSLTWEPFGNHIDFAGTYTRDRETGALSLTPESGNLQLGTGTTGIAKINDAGQLEIHGWHPGSRVKGSPQLCDTVYEK